MSVSLGPETLDPSPYEISNMPSMVWDVFDAEAVYLCFPLQAALEQLAAGTQRSDEPAKRLAEHMRHSPGWCIRTVKIDEEVLRRGTDRDGAGPLRVLVLIGGGLALAFCKSASALVRANRSNVCSL